MLSSETASLLLISLLLLSLILSLLCSPRIVISNLLLSLHTGFFSLRMVVSKKVTACSATSV
jgi:hypothetical protein